MLLAGSCTICNGSLATYSVFPSQQKVEFYICMPDSSTAGHVLYLVKPRGNPAEAKAHRTSTHPIYSIVYSREARTNQGNTRTNLGGGGGMSCCCCIMCAGSRAAEAAAAAAAAAAARPEAERVR